MKHFFLLLALTLTACNNGATPCVAIKTSGQILPLSIGNTWIYHITELDFGTITKSLYDTVTISRDTFINGEKWFFYSGEIVINRSDGLWGFYQISKDSITPVLVWEYPIKSGNVIHQPYDSIIVAATDTVISVPYGCFFSNVYFVGRNKEYSECFVPGIGRIKSEQWYDGYEHHDKIKQIELVSATLH